MIFHIIAIINYIITFDISVIFHVVLLGLATLSVIVTLMNSSIIRRTIPVPEWMTFLMRGKLGSFFCPATPKSTVNFHFN